MAVDRSEYKSGGGADLVQQLCVSGRFVIATEDLTRSHMRRWCCWLEDASWA